MLSNEAEEVWTSVLIKKNMTALRKEKHTNDYYKSDHKDITFSVQKQKVYLEAC